MISWKLAKKLFDGFTILRWTDFLRPVEFVQMEKSAIQAVLTYIIGKEYEERMRKKGQEVKLDWELIVDINVYGLLSKIATSDIKSTINKKIKQDHLNELTEFILSVYYDKNGKGIFFDSEIIEKAELENYVLENESNKERVENKICYFAHKYATYREFLSIKMFNEHSPDMDRVEKELNGVFGCRNKKDKSDEVLNQICDEVQYKANTLNLFFTYFEKLRPQIRWSQTCRTPQTTVLGHSMYVAVLTYFAVKELKLKNDADKILVDSFYCALFHDLPESLTRDIISPVKRSIKDLENELAKYEYIEVNERMISLLSSEWKNHFLYLLGAKKEEFKTFMVRKTVLGDLIKLLDYVAAFVEAKMSVDLGINSEELQNGIKFTSGKIKDVVVSYKKNGIVSENKLSFNEFLASIPQYDIGYEL